MQPVPIHQQVPTRPLRQPSSYPGSVVGSSRNADKPGPIQPLKFEAIACNGLVANLGELVARLYCGPPVSSGAYVYLRLEVLLLRAGFPERIMIISYSLNEARWSFAPLRTVHGMHWLVDLEAALFRHREERH